MTYGGGPCPRVTLAAWYLVQLGFVNEVNHKTVYNHIGCVHILVGSKMSSQQLNLLEPFRGLQTCLWSRAV